MLTVEGAILLNNEKKELLEKTLWVDGKLNREVIAKPAKFIADKIKLDVEIMLKF